MYYPNNSLADEITNINDVFSIKAKPHIKNSHPYILNLYSSSLSSANLNRINVKGKNFFNITNVYLSATQNTMIDGITLFNPFSAFPNLYPYNPSFYGVVIPTFFIGDNFISFNIPQIKESGYIDVIIENEAGYSVLSRDSYNPSLSANRELLLPCISGIKVNVI
jgi:hypothetical protein